MNSKKISKFLSLILRHKPELIQLELDKNGWADVQELIKKSRNFGKAFDQATLEQVVAENDKKRFAFSENGQKIRASQGQSIAVDLQYEAVAPPAVLYHGTATRFLTSIFEKGILKGNRHLVHLSAESETATAVGKRHGKVVILEIDAAQMQQAGHVFYCSENGVWLTEEVPPRYILTPAYS